MSEPPLIVGITSLPSRVGLIRPCLDSLMDGTRPPDRIVLALPCVSIREQTGYVLPDFLSDPGFCRGIVEVVRSDRDWGPGTKLLGALDRLPDTCCLVLADDDVRYTPTFLAELYAAQVADRTSSFSFYTYRTHGLDIGQGCDGFSIWRPHLAGIREFAERHIVGTDLFFHDDLWISFFLRTKGVRVKSLEGRLPSGGTIYEALHHINALHQLGGSLTRRRLNRLGLKRLLRDVAMPAATRLGMRLDRIWDRSVARHIRSAHHRLSGAARRKRQIES